MASVLVVVCLVPFAALVSAYAARSRAFPVLTPFSVRAWQGHFFRADGARVVGAPGAPSDDHHFVRLALEPGKYPGFVIDEPYPTWTGYERLEFAVRTEGATPLDVTIRIHDRTHDERYEDRFNRAVYVTSELQRVVVRLSDVAAAPMARRLDLSNIEGIVLFVKDLDRPAVLWISELTLHR